MMFGLLSGDRGGWFYMLLILLWMHNTFYKRMSIRKVILLSVGGILSLYIISAIVRVRNTDLSMLSILNELSSYKNNPVLDSIFEMGSTMGVTIVTIHDNLHYPLGNSYLMSLFGAITTHIPKFFGIDYITVTRWFSQEYLEIKWGAGYSIIAEAIINFGLYFAPLTFIVFAKLFFKILRVKSDNINSALKMYVSIAVASFLMNMIRNTTHDCIRGVVFGILPIMIIYSFISQKERGGIMNDQKKS